MPSVIDWWLHVYCCTLTSSPIFAQSCFHLQSNPSTVGRHTFGNVNLLCLKVADTSVEFWCLISDRNGTWHIYYLICLVSWQVSVESSGTTYCQKIFVGGIDKALCSGTHFCVYCSCIWFISKLRVLRISKSIACMFLDNIRTYAIMQANFWKHSRSLEALSPSIFLTEVANTEMVTVSTIMSMLS